MEESEKRKERLKALRMEASQSGDYDEGLGSSSVGYGGLANPLTDSPSGKVESYGMPRPRFDYYTDPMSAFSANKRSNNKVSPQVSQQCYTPPGNYLFFHKVLFFTLNLQTCAHYVVMGKFCCLAKYPLCD